jgi:hypothetical protein
MRIVPLRHLPPSLSLLLRRPAAAALFAYTGLAVAGHWALVLATADYADPAAVLHYNAYFGIDQVGSWHKAMLLPAAATVAWAVDAAAATWLIRRDHWLAQGAVLAGAVTATLLLAVTAAVRYQFR